MRFYFERYTEGLRSTQVKKVMPKRTLITIHKDLSIPKLLSLFEKHNVSDFPVVDDENELMGDVHIKDILPFAIDPENLSEHEVVGVLGTELHDIFGSTVEDIMKFHEESVSPETLVSDVALLMWKDEIRCVTILDHAKNGKEKLVGIISEKDIVNLLFNKLKDVKVK